ncbi:MAG: SIMPL domain-containing protein [bacterium]
MIKKQTLVLIFMFLAFSSLAAAEPTEIIVSGNGKIMADADIAYVTIGVEQTKQSAAQAQKATSEKMNSVQASLQQIGIPKDKIETTNIRLSPNYEYTDRKRTFTGYSASNQIKITVDKLDQVGKVLDTVIPAGATTVNDVTFTLKDETNYKQQALKKAVEKAKEKAKSMAEAAGLSLKKIKVLQESSARIEPVYRGPLMAEASMSSSNTPVSPGDVAVYGSVTVIYECD